MGSLLFGVLVAHYLQQKDKRSDEDRVRLYEPLHAELAWVLSNKRSAMDGSGASFRNEGPLPDIIARGALLHKRHRPLKADVDELVRLMDAETGPYWEFQRLRREATQNVIDTTDYDDGKGNIARLSKVLGANFGMSENMWYALTRGDKELWAKEFVGIIIAQAHIAGTQIVPKTTPDEMYDAIDAVILSSREKYLTATKSLFRKVEAVNARLEAAMESGSRYA